MKDQTKRMGHQNNWLTPKRMSEKYGIPESTLLNWKLLEYITSATIGGRVVLDEDSLIHLLENHKVNALSDEQLEKIIKEKERECEVLLARFEDEQFLLRALEPYRQLFQVVIRQLGQLITDEQLREIFLFISLGGPISQTAKQHEMSYEQVLTAYKSILTELNKNTGRIAALCNPPQNPLIFKFNNPDPLSIPLHELMQVRAYGVLLREGEICTVRDLLKYVSEFGWKSLLDFPGLGMSTYMDILDCLHEAGFIIRHKDGNAELSPNVEPWVI